MSGPGVTAQVKLQSSMLNSFNGFSGIGSPFNINTRKIIVQVSPIIALLETLKAGAAQLIIHPLEYGSMFQDRAGTIPVTESGQLVGHVLDVGGGNFHATAVSDAARGIYREVGVLRYIEYNGVNTAYQTPVLPAPGVNKTQMFAGLRRTTDQLGVFFESSPDASSNNGATLFYYSNGYFYLSRGSNTQSVLTAGFAHSIPSVLTGLGDISASFIRLRVNGTQVAQKTSSLGTGNYNPFGTYRLNYGARAGTSFFFNGHYYGTLGPITRFGTNATEDQIEAAEAYYTKETGL